MRAPAAYALFDTAIGRCGIAWRGDEVCAITLPTTDESRTIGSLGRCCGDLVAARPPAAIRKAMAQIESLLAGEDVDLSEIGLDLGDATDFERGVYAEASKIRRGNTRTYGEIAKALGDPQSARAVGRALGRNPVPIIVPCHRVVAANGRLGGFSAPGGRISKVRLLEIEGAVPADEPPTLFDAPVKGASQRGVCP